MDIAPAAPLFRAEKNQTGVIQNVNQDVNLTLANPRKRDCRRPHPVVVVLGLMFALTAPPSMAQTAVDHLQRFFDEVKTFGANFDQIVMDEGLNIVEETNGQMWIARPGRFRWDYSSPSEQKIVGDGDRIWLYDKDLEQVTVRSQSETVGRTPAILLAGSGDLAQSYDVEDLGPQGQSSWVGLTPKDGESQFESVRIGFDMDGRLVVMELVDGFGQTTRISLHDAKENSDLDPVLFAFEPPEGVDVIDESQ